MRSSMNPEPIPATTTGRSMVLGVVNETTRAEIAQALKNAGWRVTAVEDGLAVLEAIRRGNPAYAVFEIALPRLSGIEILEQIREQPRSGRMTTLVIVDSPDAEPRLESLAFGASGWIDAELTPAMFVNAIERWENDRSYEEVAGRAPVDRSQAAGHPLST